MAASIPKPPYDPVMGEFLKTSWPMPRVLTPEMVRAMREVMGEKGTAEGALAGEPLTHEERSIAGPDGNTITLSIFRPIQSVPAMLMLQTRRPCIYEIHGGGLVAGNRFITVKESLQWAKELAAVVVSVEYRLAPEHTFPAAPEDCYAGLKWVVEHADELGIDPNQVMVAGQSAGGGLAAATAMLARDRGGPAIRCQLLDCPMLDDRCESLSIRLFANEGTWPGENNKIAWGWYLGPDQAGKDVSPYAAAARATDLSNLPPACINVGAAEPFREEAVEYARKLWAAGVQAELHVYPGAFHGFDMVMPTHPLSKQSMDTKMAWVKRNMQRAPAAGGPTELQATGEGSRL